MPVAQLTTEVLNTLRERKHRIPYVKYYQFYELATPV